MLPWRAAAEGEQAEGKATGQVMGNLCQLFHENKASLAFLRARLPRCVLAEVVILLLSDHL